MSTHLDRKELKRPDAFQNKAGSLFEYASKHTKALVAGLVVLLVVAAALTLYSRSKAAKSEEANNALFLVKREYAAATAKAPKEGDWESALKGEVTKMEELAKKHKGTQAAYEAYLMLGDTQYDRGTYAKAGEYYKQAIDSSPSKGMKVLARHSLAYAFEGEKKTDEAIDQLKQVVGSGEKSIKGDTLMALARNYAVKGDKAKAVEHYDQVSKDFPNSQLSKTAEAQKNALR